MMVAANIAGQVDALYGYVQERFLWQFYSRTKDRSENIDGITEQATRLLLGEEPARATPAERLQAVDAKVMVDDFRERFPWLLQADPDHVRTLMQGLRERLTDIAITRSKNRELNHTLY